MDNVCNCPEASKQYYLDYYRTSKGISTSRTTNKHSYLLFVLAVFPGHADYSKNLTIYGMTWRCDLCSNNIDNATTSATCNCSAARSAYITAYHDYITGDPYDHYISVGVAQGFAWDCRICNDTCHSAPSASNAFAYPSQQFQQGANTYIPSGCYVPLSSTSVSMATLTVNGSLECIRYALSKIKLSPPNSY